MNNFDARKDETRDALKQWARWVTGGGRYGCRGYPSHAAMVGAVEVLTSGNVTRLTARGTATIPAYHETPADCPAVIAEVDGAVCALPPELRRVIFARYLGGTPWESIARATRRTINAVRGMESDAVSILTYNLAKLATCAEKR